MVLRSTGGLAAGARSGAIVVGDTGTGSAGFSVPAGAIVFGSGICPRGLRCSDCPLFPGDGAGVDCTCGGADGLACDLSPVSLERDGPTSLTGATGTGVAGFTVASVASSSGLPGLAASAGCCAAKGTGLGGGAVFATTSRSITVAGGLRPEGAAPRTLSCSGATVAATLTGAVLIASFDISTLDRATG